MARKRHWHVLAGLQGGYMPDTNDMCDTRKDAVADALWHVEQARESGLVVHGNARVGYWEVLPPKRERSPWTLGSSISIECCTDSSCEEYRDLD